MAIILRIDVMLARRKTKARELARAIGISETNLSLLKSGKVGGVRFNTLNAICKYFGCQPGELIEYVPDDDDEDTGDAGEEPDMHRQRA